jgi:hypothetical protein
MSEDGRILANVTEQASVFIVMNAGFELQSVRNAIIHCIQKGKEGTPAIDKAMEESWKQAVDLIKSGVSYLHGPQRERRRLKVLIKLATDLLTMWKSTGLGYGPGKHKSEVCACPWCKVLSIFAAGNFLWWNADVDDD